MEADDLNYIENWATINETTRKVWVWAYCFENIPLCVDDFFDIGSSYEDALVIGPVGNKENWDCIKEGGVYVDEEGSEIDYSPGGEYGGEARDQWLEMGLYEVTATLVVKPIKVRRENG